MTVDTHIPYLLSSLFFVLCILAVYLAFKFNSSIKVMKSLQTALCKSSKENNELRELLENSQNKERVLEDHMMRFLQARAIMQDDALRAATPQRKLQVFMDYLEKDWAEYVIEGRDWSDIIKNTEKERVAALKKNGVDHVK